jgi:hypothetical protein
MTLGAGLATGILVILVSALIQCRHAHWIKVCAGGGAVLALLVLAAPVLACRDPLNELTILLDAIPPGAEGSEVIARAKFSRCTYANYRDFDPFMWLVHASCNQSEALRMDRSSKSMPNGPPAVVDSISARSDATVLSPGASSRSPMKPSLMAVGPTARSVSSEEARERR